MLSEKSVYPQGSAASCGIENGEISISPIENFSSITTFFLFLSDIFSLCFGIASNVLDVAKTGISNFFDIFPTLWIWSTCSCVTITASKSAPETFILSRPCSIFFKLTPASISTFVFSVSTNKQLPLLPLYKLQKFNIGISSFLSIC